MKSFTRASPSISDTAENATADRAALVSTLTEFFRHLSAGDARAAAAVWDVPALILGDEYVHGPLSRDRLAEMLADAPGPGALEVAALRGGPAPPCKLSIESIEWPSQRIAAVEARWPRLPRGGLLHGIEAATFLLRSDELGHPKIRGLVLHSARLSPARA
jgi:hypothetical protein